jgi:hypothetical protein
VLPTVNKGVSLEVESLRLDCPTACLIGGNNLFFANFLGDAPRLSRLVLSFSNDLRSQRTQVLSDYVHGSFGQLVECLSSVYDTLKELDIACGRDIGNDFLRHINEPASFRPFRALKRLFLPLDAVTPLSVIHALPLALEALYIYSADARFMHWFDEFRNDRSVYPVFQTLSLDIRGYHKRTEDWIIMPLLYQFVQGLAQMNLVLRIYNDKERPIREKRMPMLEWH